MNIIHLVCNAHLDPVWLWQWEEGAGEALSTFRVAADFCEEYGGFVFNHNEALLYQWVEQYEPELFERIVRLVEKGKWHIMGGWFLQPDCNMPSGESFIRQILTGRIYFADRFSARPETAINFDSFGHSRGLVQILKKSGFDSYLFCRPDQSFCELEDNDFIWKGYDGSEIAGHRAFRYYLSKRGKVDEKIRDYMDKHPDHETGLLLWGIGNHGGGPSRADLELISRMMEENGRFELVHSTPEDFFREKKKTSNSRPVHAGDLNPFSVGCYTTQIRIKQRHRKLENSLYMTEKMTSHAAMQGFLEYPEEEFRDARRDLLFSQFHDILPGTSTEPAESDSLRMMDHGLEILSRIRARAFFALTAGQRKGEDGEVPIFIYNPHPWTLENRVVECEFMRPPGRTGEGVAKLTLYRDGIAVQSQTETECSNLKMDWRKKISFRADLPAASLSRFDCRVEMVPELRPLSLPEAEGDILRIETEELEIHFNCRTGLVDLWKAGGFSCLDKGAFLPVVMEDNDDAWGMRTTSFGKEKGSFSLMTDREGNAFSGIEADPIPSVRIVEHGEIRTVVEVLMKYETSSICMRYGIPARGTEVELGMRVYWNEKTSMLKLRIPTLLRDSLCLGQKPCGFEPLNDEGEENVSQKWLSIESRTDPFSFVCLNDGTYGSDFEKGTLRLSLLRSPGFSGHPVQDLTIMRDDRFSPRIDQGERCFSFAFDCLSREDRETLDRRALVFNEKPFVNTFFPSGRGEAALGGPRLRDRAVQMMALKKSEVSGDYIVRLFEPTGSERSTVLVIPLWEKEFPMDFSPFQIRTFRLDSAAKELCETNLIEEDE